jgi:Ca2+-binding RTX toxin-like protein
MLHSIETLDARRLLSVSINTGVVMVTGTAGNDVITIEHRADGPKIIVTVNGTETPLNESLVTKIIVSAGDGNDKIVCASTDGGMWVPTYLRGGPGSDTIRGGYGKDTIYGGDGRDNIRGSYSSDVIDGEGDADWLFGDNGNDLIRGGDGNDDLDGGAHNDTLEGGAGEDDLNGGSGTDKIYGGAGNDDFAVFVDADSELIDRNLDDIGNNTNL